MRLVLLKRGDHELSVEVLDVLFGLLVGELIQFEVEGVVMGLLTMIDSAGNERFCEAICYCYWLVVVALAPRVQYRLIKR